MIRQFGAENSNSKGKGTKRNPPAKIWKFRQSRFGPPPLLNIYIKN